MPVRRGALVVAVLVVAVGLVVGCSDDDPSSSPSSSSAGETSTTAASSPTSALFDAVCADDADVTDAGTITTPEVTEASGLAASRRNPGAWWTHNDGDESARVFAIADDGTLLATVAVSGAQVRDWEDIAVGPPVDADGSATVYVADIGDNAIRIDKPENTRSSIKVYRFTEPEIDPAARDAAVDARADTLTLTYPDGPHDAEALMVDPDTGDLVIVTKDWPRTGSSGVYRAPVGLADGSTTVLERVGTVDFDRGTLVTAADVSPDGSVVALRTYGDVRLYRRADGQPLWSAFESEPCSMRVRGEFQGESLGFSADGSSFLTASEGSEPVLHRTSR